MRAKPNNSLDRSGVSEPSICEADTMVEILPARLIRALDAFLIAD
jgi:hypothetical protein